MSLEKFAKALSTKSGFWGVMGVTAVLSVLYLWGPNLSTYIISVVAIIIPQVILYRDAQRDHVDHARDVAMHIKLDELIRANKEARNELIGIEQQVEDLEA